MGFTAGLNVRNHANGFGQIPSSGVLEHLRDGIYTYRSSCCYHITTLGYHTWSPWDSDLEAGVLP